MAMARKMTAKGFYKKLNSKAAASALGFIAAHREYLMSGELSELTKPILDKIDAGELYPTPAILELKQVVACHILNMEKAKADKAIERASRNSGRSSKAFEAVILDSVGRIVLDDDGKDLRKTFDKPQEAERWVDRRLFEHPNTIGEVIHHGSPWETIERDDSIARILKRPKSPFMKRRPNPGNLSGRMKASETKVTFSKG